MFLSCRNLKNLDVLSKSDPQIEVYTKDRTIVNWALIGRTEVVNNNLNPDFSTFVECDYYFEREQQIKFIVYDIDSKVEKELIGTVETTIGKIIGSVKQTFLIDILNDKSAHSRGKLIVRLDNVSTTNDEARLKLSARLNPLGFLCC